MSERELVHRIAALEKEVRELRALLVPLTYKGEQAGNFTTTELPRPGDYGTQTGNTELQVNINGVVRAITTAAP